MATRRWLILAARSHAYREALTNPANLSSGGIFYCSYTCSGMSWICNCFIELGIRIDSLPPHGRGHGGFSFGGRPEPFFRYVGPSRPGWSYWAATRSLVLQAMVPAIQTQSTFEFPDNLWIKSVDHALPPIVASHRTIAMVRDPRDTLWSEFRNFPQGLSFREFAELNAREWACYYRAVLMTPNLKIVRFEDYKSDPVACLKSALDFCSLDFPQDRIKHAVQQSSFERGRELETSFVQRHADKGVKIRATYSSGRRGQWREQHTHAEAFSEISRVTKRMRERLGYSE
jgi:hypothetical protein